MRLICGCYHLDGRPASSEQLAVMAGEMTATGLTPQVRSWCDGPVGLAVLDFHQAAAHTRVPLPESGRGRVLAADLRLDAPGDLAQALGQRDANEDALLLAALDRWGSEALVHVLGDYAFAAWNARTRQLLCARDALGVRPLVYTHQPGRLFAFASLPRGLYGAGLIERRLDELALARQIVQAWRPERTLFEGISRLPARHVLEVGPHTVTLRRYWQLDAAAAGTRHTTPEEAAQELRRVIEQAVRCRMPAVGPVAADLSGGLDSSALSILAARRLRDEGRRLHGYSFLATPHNGVALEDETPFVEAVRAQEVDIAWTPVRHPPMSRWLEARMDLDRVVSLEADDPENTICREAAAQGASIALSGWGGDEGATFNGRGALAESLLHGRWRHLAHEIRALKGTRGLSAAQVWRGEVLSYLLPDGLMALARRIRGRPKSRQWQDALAPSLLARLGDIEADALHIGPDARLNRLALLSSAHVAERAEHWALMAARHGLAYTFPMLDRRVVEFALSLPSALFLRGGFKRRVFRDAMEGVLPELIRWRHPKLMPFPEVLIGIAESRHAIAKRLEVAAGHPRVRAIFNVERLLATAGSFPPADEMHAGQSSSRTTIALAMMASLLPAIAYVEQHY
jgi:asparagine synthase (glutamine-hydrolysing)